MPSKTAAIHSSKHSSSIEKTLKSSTLQISPIENSAHHVKFHHAPANKAQTPSSLASESLLRFYGVQFDDLESNNKHNLSAGTLPCIEDVDGTIASGVDGINKHLRESRGDVLDAHLLAVDHANGKALKKNLEDHMHWITLYYRWSDKKGWKFFKKHLLKKMGKLAKMFGGLLARKPMKRMLKQQGTGRKSPLELNRIAIQIFTQVKSVIGNRKFLFGDRPSSYDAEVFAYTTIWMMWPISHPIKRFLLETECLNNYVQRVCDVYFADGGGIGMSPAEVHKVSLLALQHEQQQQQSMDNDDEGDDDDDDDDDGYDDHHDDGFAAMIAATKPDLIQNTGEGEIRIMIPPRPRRSTTTTTTTTHATPAPVAFRPVPREHLIVVYNNNEISRGGAQFIPCSKDGKGFPGYF